MSPNANALKQLRIMRGREEPLHDRWWSSQYTTFGSMNAVLSSSSDEGDLVGIIFQGQVRKSPKDGAGRGNNYLASVKCKALVLQSNI